MTSKNLSMPTWHTVHHSSFHECLEAIKHAHSTYGSSRPRSVRIVGYTGVGKTALIDEMEKLFPRSEDRNGICVPMLRVEIPANPTEKTLLIEMLRALGDPVPTMGTRGVMENRLYVMLRNAHVQIILVDEVQHFVLNGNRISLNASADMFKSLINKVEIPIALIGMRSSRELFYMSSQLRSRIPLEYELRAFNWAVESHRPEFLAVFKSQFPLGFENDEFLFQPKIAHCLWFSTNGLLRPIRDLCEGLRKLAESNKKLTEGVLAKAFQTSIWSGCRPTRNPFDKQFNLTTLEGSGEPFERDEVEGGAHDSAYRVPAASLSRRRSVGVSASGGGAKRKT